MVLEEMVLILKVEFVFIKMSIRELFDEVYP